MRVVAAVGTFVHGFDALVTAADRACAALGIDGFAQIGHSSIEPTSMAFERFVPRERLVEHFRQAGVVICHAGMGIVGEAMRAGAPLILFPRTGATRRDHPANDQLAFARRIAACHGLGLCERPDELPGLVERMLREPRPRTYGLFSDVAEILAGWLAASAPSSR